jgi:chemotaxis protein methyltransferase CheR
VTLSAADFSYVSELVRRRSAIVLTAGKEYLVENRLQPVARSNGGLTFEELIRRLRSTAEGTLHTQVVEAMTTNETSWFRDHHTYDALELRILPELIQRRAAERRLTVWSAGSSSGQEAYSIAMLLHERLATDPSWRIRIIATDLSSHMVDRTRAGRYSQLEINRGLPAVRLVRHFHRTGTEWQVNDSLRALLDVRQMNLALPFPVLPLVDVVFLRNVLIYFDLSTKKTVLRALRRVLKPDGYLALGGAETTLNVDSAFVRVPLDKATMYQIRDGQAAA